jgi:hypothetical protein
VDVTLRRCWFAEKHRGKRYWIADYGLRIALSNRQSGHRNAKSGDIHLFMRPRV